MVMFGFLDFSLFTSSPTLPPSKSTSRGRVHPETSLSNIHESSCRCPSHPDRLHRRVSGNVCVIFPSLEPLPSAISVWAYLKIDQFLFTIQERRGSSLQQEIAVLDARSYGGDCIIEGNIIRDGRTPMCGEDNNSEDSIRKISPRK